MKYFTSVLMLNSLKLFSSKLLIGYIFFQNNYYITADKKATKLTSDQCFHIEKKKPKAQQKIKDPQTDLPDVPDMTFSFFPAHLF